MRGKLRRTLIVMAQFRRAADYVVKLLNGDLPAALRACGALSPMTRSSPPMSSPPFWDLTLTHYSHTLRIGQAINSLKTLCFWIYDEVRVLSTAPIGF